MNPQKPVTGSLAPLESLLETLDQLLDQARMYERILPVDNYPARGAVAVLGELARKVMNEAKTLVDILEARPSPDHPFSPREYQVLKLAAHGLTNKEIAFRLTIGERTVQFHMNSIFNKTGTNSRTEAVSLSIFKQWLNPEPD